MRGALCAGSTDVYRRLLRLRSTRPARSSDGPYLLVQGCGTTAGVLVAGDDAPSDVTCGGSCSGRRAHLARLVDAEAPFAGAVVAHGVTRPDRPHHAELAVLA